MNFVDKTQKMLKKCFSVFYTQPDLFSVFHLSLFFNKYIVRFFSLGRGVCVFVCEGGVIMDVTFTMCNDV